MSRNILMSGNILFSAFFGATTLLAACAMEDEPQFESVDQEVESIDQESSLTLSSVSHSNLSFTDLGTTLFASGIVSGLPSNHDKVVIKLIVIGKATATCTNPGGNQPPGQNPVVFPVTLTGSTTVPAHEIRSGKISFKVTTSAPRSPVPGAPDCPNPNWTEKITDVAFTTAKIIVFQPESTTVLAVSCTCSPPTSNGPVPGSTVTCQSG